ncbi:MAG: disulfide bond formation protein DsbA [Rhodobacteraceae bacterium]|nr:MAG: disulfide bond formation protein DsbA [Paracoccaceae bacterium]
MRAPLEIHFYHDAVCCWCFNISARLRRLAGEFDLDIRHRTFVLQASRAEMAARWGRPEQARATILGHWATCRAASDHPERIDIAAMRRAGFDYPHGWNAALACKAAERLGGQAAHWDMFDRVQTAHLSEARNIADPAVLADLAREVGLNAQAFEEASAAAEVAGAVDRDRRQAWMLGIRSIPALILQPTGTRLENGSIEELRAQIRASAGLIPHY